MAKSKPAKRRPPVTRVPRQTMAATAEPIADSTATTAASSSRPRALTDVDITRPHAGDLVRVVNGAIPVTVFNNAAGFTEVWARVYGMSETPDTPSGATGPAGSVNLTNNGGGVYSGSVGVTTAENSLQIVAWGRRPSDNAWTAPQITEVKRAVPVTKTVDATSCLWFTWAPAGTGPWNEPIAGHRPVGVDVPAAANQVTITAAGSWRHDPADSAASGPEGRDALDQAKPGYRAIAPGIEPLPDGDCRLNLLVGMWVFSGQGGEEQVGREIAIGAGRTLVIPSAFSYSLVDGVARFYLGFHDGYQWNNNTGSVQVELTFYTER